MCPEFRDSLAVTRRGKGRSAREGLQVLLSVGPGTWQQEAGLIGEHLATLASGWPGQLREEHDSLLERLKAAR